MRHRLIGIAVGLLVGAAVGSLTAVALAPAPEPEPRVWTYPTVGQLTGSPLIQQGVRGTPEFRYWLFLGLLLGGGFGAVTGAVVSVGEQPRTGAAACPTDPGSHTTPSSEP